MIWLAGVILIPIIVVIMLAVSAADDFMQIIKLRIDFSRFFGDLIHVLAIVVIGALAEIFCLFELVTHLL